MIKRGKRERDVAVLSNPLTPVFDMEKFELQISTLTRFRVELAIYVRCRRELFIFQSFI